jgi:hypothetical protein
MTLFILLTDRWNKGVYLRLSIHQAPVIRVFIAKAAGLLRNAVLIYFTVSAVLIMNPGVVRKLPGIAPDLDI